MKIENLKFGEAVNHLRNGKCDSIRRDDWDNQNSIFLRDNKLYLWKQGGVAYLPEIEDILADDWYLINIQKEKIELEGIISGFIPNGLISSPEDKSLGKIIIDITNRNQYDKIKNLIYLNPKIKLTIEE